MAGRPVMKKADIEKIQGIVLATDGIVDYQPLIAYIMRSCGCTYTEIGEVFGISRQLAQYLIKRIEGEDEAPINS